MCMALLMAPFSVFAATIKETGAAELEISNKTRHPINVFQGQWKAVVLPDERLLTQDFKDASLTVSTSTPEAAIRFVSLTTGKGCKAKICVLITGN